MGTLRGMIAAILVGLLVWPASAEADGRSIDVGKSSIRVRVYKAGLFSALGHSHEVEAPLESREVTEAGSPFVELRVDARKLRVLDPEASADTRAQIQTTMHGSQVLYADRYSEIHFRSTVVEPNGIDRWRVSGNLNLHGQTHPVVIDVTLKDGIYEGSTILKQTAFGITPVTVAGGTVKVKDDLRIDFQIALTK